MAKPRDDSTVKRVNVRKIAFVGGPLILLLGVFWFMFLRTSGETTTSDSPDATSAGTEQPDEQTDDADSDTQASETTVLQDDELYVFEDADGRVVVANRDQTPFQLSFALPQNCPQAIELVQTVLDEAGSSAAATEDQQSLMIIYSRLSEELCSFRVFTDLVGPMLEKWSPVAAGPAGNSTGGGGEADDVPAEPMPEMPTPDPQESSEQQPDPADNDTAGDDSAG